MQRDFMPSPYIVTISSEKGGVGKTTLATNLAIYLKALHEDLPVTLLSFDNHFSVDQMFRINRASAKGIIQPDCIIDIYDHRLSQHYRRIIQQGQKIPLTPSHV